MVTYSYTLDNQLDTVEDWDGGVTTYEYDEIGRLITMTIPAGISSVGAYDKANRVIGLTHTDANGFLLGEYSYMLDGVGKPQVVTESLMSPVLISVTKQFLESGGMLVLEAEDGETAANGEQSWQEKTNQSGYSGDGYMQALPDVGTIHEIEDTDPHPAVQFSAQIETTGEYAAWIRGYASDGGSDSLHLTVDGEADNSTRISGFAPRSWEWSHLTMSNTHSTLTIPSSGIYDLQLLMREDGLRVDKLLLITDTNYIPTGDGPAASDFESITNTVSSHLQTHTIAYAYDNLYRLKEATYTGAITGTYQYDYNAVGSRTAYTTTLNSTTVTTYTYDAANHLQTARADDTGVTWHYIYDGNGQRIRQIPVGLTPADGETRYSFNQAGQMIRIEKHDGSTYTTQADIGYDGMGNRVLGTTYIEGVPVTVTYTLDGSFGQPLVIATDAATTLILYGKYAIGEYKLNAAPAEAWQYYLGDGELSVRQLADSDGNISLTRTYAPYGILLAKEGDGAALFGYAGGQTGMDGLWYFGDGYYDPQTGEFLAAGEKNPFGPLAASGGLLFAPLFLWGWRWKKKGKGWVPPAGLFMLVLFVAAGLTSHSINALPTDVGYAPALPPEIRETAIRHETAIRQLTRTRMARATTTVVTIQRSATCTLQSTSTAIPTVTPTNNSVFQKYLSIPDIPTGDMVTFSACETCTWAEGEMAAVQEAASRTGIRLAEVLNAIHDGWNLSAHDAFMHVYGRTVKFIKTGTLCERGLGCWGKTFLREDPVAHEIEVYTDAGVISDPHWAVHELGHAFVNTGRGVLSDLERYRDGFDYPDIYIKFPDRPITPNNPNGTWGFAGRRWDWQRSALGRDSEEFADMYLGWVYDKWEARVDGRWTVHGQMRADFMDYGMSLWLDR